MSLTLRQIGGASSTASTAVFNPRDTTYGAKADGSTDDTVALQAAQDAAAAAGGTLFLSGTIVTQGLILDSNVRISCAGGTVLKLKDATPWVAGVSGDVIVSRGFASLASARYGGSGAGTSSAGIHGWRIDAGLTIDGNRDNQTGTNTRGAGIRVYGYDFDVDEPHIRNCVGSPWISEWASGGVPAAVGNDGVAESMESHLSNAKMHDCGAGLIWDGPHDSSLSRPVLYGLPSGAVGIEIGAKGNGMLIDRGHPWRYTATGRGPLAVGYKLVGQATIQGGQAEGHYGGTGIMVLANRCIIDGTFVYLGSSPYNGTGVQIGAAGTFTATTDGSTAVLTAVGALASTSGGLSLTSAFAGLSVGMAVTGTGIQASTTISALDPVAGTITLSKTTTAAGTPTITYSLGISSYAIDVQIDRCVTGPFDFQNDGGGRVKGIVYAPGVSAFIGTPNASTALDVVNAGSGSSSTGTVYKPVPYFAGGSDKGAVIQVARKAGSLADTDFPVTPLDGTLAVNTSGKTLAYRSGGAWYEAGQAVNTLQPADNGLLGWSYPPVGSVSATLTLGVPFMARIKVRGALTVGTIWYVVTVAGATLTAGSCPLAVYTYSGSTWTMIGTAADQATNFASTGVKSAAITVVAGKSLAVSSDIYVGLLANGTTAPQLASTGIVGSVNVVDFGPNAAPYAGSNQAISTQTTLADYTGGSNKQALFLVGVS